MRSKRFSLEILDTSLFLDLAIFYFFSLTLNNSFFLKQETLSKKRVAQANASAVMWQNAELLWELALVLFIQWLFDSLPKEGRKEPGMVQASLLYICVYMCIIYVYYICTYMYI